MLVDIATAAAFLILAFIAFLIINALLAGRGAVSVAETGDVALTSSPRKPGPIKRLFASAIPQMGTEIEQIRADLLRAGYYQHGALEDYLAMRNVGILLVLGLFGTLVFLGLPNRDMTPILIVVGLVAAIAMYGLPRLALGRQARSRVARIERGLPDALDMVQMSLTGGLALRDALDRVAGEVQRTHPDIAVELNIIRRQADAGSVGQALRNFANRIDVPDVKALALTVIHTERLGTDVGVAISEFTDQMRLTSRQRAEERASKVGVLLLLPVIFCLVPPVLIAIAGPPLINLKNFLRDENKPGGILNPEVEVPPPPQIPDTGPVDLRERDRQRRY